MNGRDAWEVVDSRYVVRDRWIALRADDCRDAEGRDIAPYYVLEYPAWVSVLALTPAGEAVTIRQYRHGVGRVVLELPGGARDEGDASDLDAARRELLEETGYAAEDWQETGTADANPANQTNAIRCFLARGARLVAEPRREPTERIEVGLMSLGELLGRAYGGELRHSHHVASLFFALHALGRAQGAPEGPRAFNSPGPGSVMSDL